MRNTLPQIHGNSAHPAGKLTNKSYTNYWCTVKDCQFRNTLSHSLCPKPKCDSGASITAKWAPIISARATQRTMREYVIAMGPVEPQHL